MKKVRNGNHAANRGRKIINSKYGKTAERRISIIIKVRWFKFDFLPHRSYVGYLKKHLCPSTYTHKKKMYRYIYYLQPPSLHCSANASFRQSLSRLLFRHFYRPPRAIIASFQLIAVLWSSSNQHLFNRCYNILYLPFLFPLNR